MTDYYIANDFKGDSSPYYTCVFIDSDGYQMDNNNNFVNKDWATNSGFMYLSANKGAIGFGKGTVGSLDSSLSIKNGIYATDSGLYAVVNGTAYPYSEWGGAGCQDQICFNEDQTNQLLFKNSSGYDQIYWGRDGANNKAFYVYNDTDSRTLLEVDDDGNTSFYGTTYFSSTNRKIYGAYHLEDGLAWTHSLVFHTIDGNNYGAFYFRSERTDSGYGTNMVAKYQGDSEGGWTFAGYKYLQINTYNNVVHSSGNYNGYVQIGARNTDYMHFYTDRPAFYFNKEVTIGGELNLIGEDSGDFELVIENSGSGTAAIELKSVSSDTNDARISYIDFLATPGGDYDARIIYYGKNDYLQVTTNSLFNIYTNADSDLKLQINNPHSSRWSYLRIKNSDIYYDIAVEKDDTNALQFRPMGSATYRTFMSSDGKWYYNNINIFSGVAGDQISFSNSGYDSISWGRKASESKAFYLYNITDSKGLMFIKDNGDAVFRTKGNSSKIYLSDAFNTAIYNPSDKSRIYIDAEGSTQVAQFASYGLYLPKDVYTGLFVYGGIQVDYGIKDRGIKFRGSSSDTRGLFLKRGSGNALAIQTLDGGGSNVGTVTVGAQNSTWCHYVSDRPGNYFSASGNAKSVVAEKDFYFYNASHNVSVAQLLGFRYSGSSIYNWIPMMYYGSPSNKDYFHINDYQYANTGGGDFWICFTLPIHTYRGSAYLYIEDVIIKLKKADSSNYIKQIYIYGIDNYGNTSAIQTYNTSIKTSGSHTIDFAATNCSSYAKIILCVYAYVSTANYLEFSAPWIKAWYVYS